MPRADAPSLTRRERAVIAVRGADVGLYARRVRVAQEDVVYVKGILEGSEGLASLFAERGGDLTLACPHDRQAELEGLLDDLVAELGAELDPKQESP